MPRASPRIARISEQMFSVSPWKAPRRQTINQNSGPTRRSPPGNVADFRLSAAGWAGWRLEAFRFTRIRHLSWRTNRRLHAIANEAGCDHHAGLLGGA